MKNKIDCVKQTIINQLTNCPYKLDIGDLGNEIGVIIGRLTKDEVSEFKFGLNHGISLSDGTH